MILSFDFKLVEFQDLKASSLKVHLAFGVSDLNFKFTVIGESPDRFPSLLSKESRKRKDDLWKNDCFEIFWDFGGEDYFELNLSPTGHWQVYSFLSERKGRAEFDVQPPILSSARGLQEYSLTGRLQLNNRKSALAYRSHPCVILNDQANGIRYYASSHPQSAPNFHDKSHWKIL